MTEAELNAIRACLRYVRNKRDGTFSTVEGMDAAFKALPIAERAVAYHPLPAPPLAGLVSLVASHSDVRHTVDAATRRTLCGEKVTSITAGEVTCVRCLRVFYKGQRLDSLAPTLRAKLYPEEGLRCPKCAGLLLWTVWPEFVQPCPHDCGQLLPPCKVPGCPNAGCIGFTPGKRVCEPHRSMLVEETS